MTGHYKSFLSGFIIALRYIRIINLDIPAGVICSVLFASRLFDVRLPVHYFFILFTSVWIIYSSDQIMDGIRSKGKRYYNEYHFHYKYRYFLIPIIIILALICGYLSIAVLDQRLISFGMSMLLLVSIYMALNANALFKGHFCLKELSIALLYTMGIFGGVLILKGAASIYQWLVLTVFFLIAYSNVLLMSLFDYKKDLHLNFSSVAVQFGDQLTGKLVLATLTLSMLLSLFTGIYFHRWKYVLILQTMTVSLCIIFFIKANKKNHKTYKTLTDAVFFFPVLSLLF